MPKTAKYKALVQHDAPLLGRQVEAGEEVEVPVEFDDGTPIVWHPDLWEPVTDKPAKAKKEG